MTVLSNLLETLDQTSLTLETFDRHGHQGLRVSGRELMIAVQAYSGRFSGWDDRGRKVVALLFKPEETIDFLAAAFAALSQGFTIVPLYPNWPAETQEAYLKAYRLRALAAGDGFKARAESWLGRTLDRIVPISLRASREEGWAESQETFRLDLPRNHPCAWLFTSGTSGRLAKLTEITLENLESAIENIQDLDFLYPGMTVHSPLSASHIFAFVAILGFLTIKPKRIIFSDVQYLARLSQAETGKVDGVILVPIVLNRMRAAFYEKLTAALSPQSAPPELKKLARIPLAARKLLKKLVLRAEKALILLETSGRSSLAGWAVIRAARALFGGLFCRRLGSPQFVVVGGAKPCLESMAFLEVMGIRCLQGWGMTETTGPLAVCRIGDRFRGALGTCGMLFRQTTAYIEDGELIVEGPQIARGYHEPDGTFTPFGGRKRTGDHAEFDGVGRLKVLGKASDRITTDNGLNYNPIPFEEEIHALDLGTGHVVEEVVVVGDGQPRLGVVFFPREGVALTIETRAYLELLVRTFNSKHAVDERIGHWAISERLFKESGFLGPSGKLVRRRVEEKYAAMFREKLGVAT
jgi:long-subunit acyl-CoA synthetase (AMP-forming)